MACICCDILLVHRACCAILLIWCVFVVLSYVSSLWQFEQAVTSEFCARYGAVLGTECALTRFSKMIV